MILRSTREERHGTLDRTGTSELPGRMQKQNNARERSITNQPPDPSSRDLYCIHFSNKRVQEINGPQR